MKAKDLNERKVEELKGMGESLLKDIFNARMKNFTNRLDNTSLLPKTRRDRARVLTILRQKELGLTPAPEKK